MVHTKIILNDFSSSCSGGSGALRKDETLREMERKLYKKLDGNRKVRKRYLEDQERVLNLSYIPIEFSKDKYVAMNHKKLQTDKSLLYILGDELLKDRQVALHLIRSNNSYFKTFSSTFHDKDFFIECLKSGVSLETLPSNVEMDMDFFIAGYSKNMSVTESQRAALSRFPLEDFKRLLHTKQVGILSLVQDQRIWLELVKEDPFIIEHLSLRTDFEDIIFFAFMRDYRCIGKLKQMYLSDSIITLLARANYKVLREVKNFDLGLSTEKSLVRDNPKIMKYLKFSYSTIFHFFRACNINRLDDNKILGSKYFKKQYDANRKSIDMCKRVFEMSEGNKSDWRSISLEALSHSREIYKFLPRTMQQDREVIEYSITESNFNSLKIPPYLFEDFEFCVKHSHFHNFMKKVNSSLKRDPEFVMKVFEHYSNTKTKLNYLADCLRYGLIYDETFMKKLLTRFPDCKIEMFDLQALKVILKVNPALVNLNYFRSRDY